MTVFEIGWHIGKIKQNKNENHFFCLDDARCRDEREVGYAEDVG